MKHNKKSFWTLDRHHAEGFTLVELIVVIAILAILAGVAIPVYSGYIKRANSAADTQLLGTINTAFAAACIDNGIDVNQVISASLPLTADKTVGDITEINGVTDSATLASYNASFDVFYTGNESAAFKTYGSIIFDAAKHAFVDPASAESVTLSYGGGVVIVSGADAVKLEQSTFIKAEGLGAQGLLNKVNDVTNLATEMMGGNAMNTILGSEGFQNAAAESLGIDLTTNPNGLNDKLDSMAADLVAQGKYTDTTAAKNQLMANAAVLYAAQNTTTMTTDDINTLLTSDNASGTITGNLTTDPGKALSQAAVAYGLYTSYAYSTGDATLIANTNDVASVLAGLDDPNFKAYINSAQGKTDAEGYLAALNMVNSSTGNPEAVTTVVANGFNDPALVKILESLIG